MIEITTTVIAANVNNKYDFALYGNKALQLTFYCKLNTPEEALACAKGVINAYKKYKLSPQVKVTVKVTVKD